MTTDAHEPKAAAPPARSPLAYLITFTCHGTRLHGSEFGSVDRFHNLPGGPLAPADARRIAAERGLMRSRPYSLDAPRRIVLLESIRSVCANRNWDLLAAHIRMNHVHLVVCADAKPERVIIDLKAYASRALNAAKLDALGQKRWSRHGSTRYLWNWKGVLAAVDYAVHGQGSPLTVFEKSVTDIRPVMDGNRSLGLRKAGEFV